MVKAKTKAEFNLSHYATKSDVKNVTSIYVLEINKKLI